ncbi:MAG: 4-alpha-glucanotransferase, partial [Sediminibacterium sp.]
MATSKKTIAAKDELPIVEKKAKAITTDKKTVVKKAAPKKTAVKKTAAKKNAVKQVDEKLATKNAPTKLHFQLRYHTEFGQNLFLTGNHVLLGNGDIANAIPMQYLNEQAWTVSIDWEDNNSKEPVQYNYVLLNPDGSTVVDWGSDRVIDIKKYKSSQIQIVDTWNHAGYFENAFYTEAFQKVLLANTQTENKTKAEKSATHLFKVKSPLLSKNQVICISGSFNKANNWSDESLVLLQKKGEDPFFEISLNLSKDQFPIAYKYGVFDLDQNKLVQFESGDNRVLHHQVVKNQFTIVNDGFTYLPNQTWKGAGVAIPVFSLRTQSSFGVGEFTDLIKMADWASMVGLKMIQLLPVNDTTATNTNKDSYPYAAISAFALHPLYLNLTKIAGKTHTKQLQQLEKERLQLNALANVDYAAVINLKLGFAKKVFQTVGKELLEDKTFLAFFEQNKHWLVSYAAFCYLRDEYGTVDFGKWPAYKNYKEKDIAELTNPQSAAYLDITFYYFLQYHLHLQLKEATAYAHKKGVIIKGDIAIGVFRHGADTWQHPDLFHMDFQAGAPPDDFAVTGQNWGFPTYHWQRM